MEHCQFAMKNKEIRIENRKKKFYVKLCLQNIPVETHTRTEGR